VKLFVSCEGFDVVNAEHAVEPFESVYVQWEDDAGSVLGGVRMPFVGGSFLGSSKEVVNGKLIKFDIMIACMVAHNSTHTNSIHLLQPRLSI
jgi:hypothetical protein